jgi:hypothetical protein
MTTEDMTHVDTIEGVEIWKLMSNGVERFAVRLGERRARMASSLAAARAVAADHLRITRLARAH